ncbi:FAD-dependent oxidoreductase [Streptomyces sp. CoH27]|uniref:FAD-dependent oxidoreductase n=1 Tax=Streptomyces sp. CoH27 TaxID=2875763 RepID=UPI001CD79FB4|nr:FAD-dependent oxidoreductase [Streptomyces sp. CoH27]
MDPVAVTEALVRAVPALGGRVLLGVSGAALRVAGARVTGVATEDGFHPADRVVPAAGTGVNALCAPLGVSLSPPVTASPERHVRLTAPPGLVNGIAAGPDFEVREVAPGQLLMTLPEPETAAAQGSAPPAPAPDRSSARGSPAGRCPRAARSSAR